MRKLKPKTPEYLTLYSFAMNWVKMQMKPFTCEDMKNAFLMQHQPIVNVNLYGLVMNALKREGLVLKNGISKAKLQPAHGRLMHKWISKEYSIQQANNRTLPKQQQSTLL